MNNEKHDRHTLEISKQKPKLEFYSWYLKRKKK